MPYRLVICTAVALAAMAPSRAGAAQQRDALAAGFGVEDITPRLDREQPIWLAGLENNRQAKEIHDSLFARAVVLSDGTRKVAWVSVDSIGLPRPSIERARRGLQDFAYVLVASTHSHASPDVIGYILPIRQWDVEPPFAYGRRSAQYGEVNSVGPATARLLMAALSDRVSEAPQR